MGFGWRHKTDAVVWCGLRLSEFNGDTLRESSSLPDRRKKNDFEIKFNFKILNGFECLLEPEDLLQ